jgi:hypothetical protein
LSLTIVALLVTAGPLAVAAHEPASNTASTTASTSSDAARVIRQAKRHIGKRFRLGTEGPTMFDCSGLVYRAFKDAGVLSKVTGRRNTARGLLNHFRARGLSSRSNGRVGDLVVWGNGKHIGIYVGNGKAISALTKGVKIHRLHTLGNKFTAFLHTRLSGSSSDSDAGSTSRGSSSKAGARETSTAAPLRTGGSTDYRRIGTIAGDTRLNILRRVTNGYGTLWYKVRLSSGKVGWVSSNLTRAAG